MAVRLRSVFGLLPCGLVRQLGDGDILCYQRAAPVLSGANGALDGAAEQPQAGGGSTKMSVDAQGPATPSKEGPEGTPKFVPPRHKDVPAFFEYIRNRQVRPLPA